jgi:DNA-binding XRE family transcriptional regulator
MYINVKIKELQATRIKAGYDVPTLCRKAKVSLTTLYGMEKGERTPRPAIAQKICKALKVDFDTLFEIKEGE